CEVVGPTLPLVDGDRSRLKVTFHRSASSQNRSKSAGFRHAFTIPDVALSRRPQLPPPEGPASSSRPPQLAVTAPRPSTVHNAPPRGYRAPPRMAPPPPHRGTPSSPPRPPPAQLLASSPPAPPPTDAGSSS